MRKGQISFDFMLALIIITVFTQTLIGLSSQFKETQDIITIRAQEKQIAIDLARIINYNKTLDPAATTSMNYKIPYIYVGGYGVPVGCDIDVGSSEITVTVDSSHYPELAEPIITTIQTTDLGTYSYNCGGST